MRQLSDLVSGSLENAVEKLAARAVIGRRLRLVKEANPTLDKITAFLSKPEVYVPLGGAGLGGLLGAATDRQNRLRGALAGAISGGALGGGTYLAQQAYSKGWPIGRDLGSTDEPLPIGPVPEERPSASTPAAQTAWDAAHAPSTEEKVLGAIGSATEAAVNKSVSAGTKAVGSAGVAAANAVWEGVKEHPALSGAGLSLAARDRTNYATPENLRAGITAFKPGTPEIGSLTARAATRGQWAADEQLLQGALKQYKQTQNPLRRAANLFRSPSEIATPGSASVASAHVKELLRAGELENFGPLKDRSKTTKLFRRSGGGRGIISAIAQLLAARVADKYAVPKVKGFLKAPTTPTELDTGLFGPSGNY